MELSEADHHCDFFMYLTVDTIEIKFSKTCWKSQTCEVDGLYGLDKIRLLHLKLLQQLRYEAHNVQLRKKACLVTMKSKWMLHGKPPR